MATYEFLSDAWFQEVDRLREPLIALEDRPMNIRIPDAPGGERYLYIAGLDIGQGALDAATATIVLPYATARRMLFEDDDFAQAGMKAVMSGEIKVEGDLSAVMDLASPLSDSGLDPDDQRVLIAIMRKRLSAFTE